MILLAKKSEEPPRPVLMDKETYEALVSRVFALATQRAKSVRRGKKFNITLPADEIPIGSHYGEIIGSLAFRAHRYGLISGLSTGWTYEFIKL